VTFVNWMRDRFDADVQILVSGLTNGGGGTENTITFIGRRAFEGMADTLVLNTLPNDPDDRGCCNGERERAVWALERAIAARTARRPSGAFRAQRGPRGRDAAT
jgi:hypothetical protein